MTSVTTKCESTQPQSETAVDLFDNWIDPIETEVRGRIRGFIETLIGEELDAALAFGFVLPKCYFDCIII